MILKNTTVLVTGGTKGIGFAVAEAFTQSGAKVFVTARNKRMSLPAGVEFIEVDFANKESVEAFLNSPLLQTVDILINNAGINKIDSFQEINEADFDEIMQVNVKAPFLLTQKIIPYMKAKQFGRIVNIASIFSHISKEKRGSYSTSKFGILGMTKAIAVEYAPFNVLCNALSPGFINTELTQTVLTADQIKELVSQVPMKRLGTSEEIAQAVLFLASPQNTFITGQNIIADGGFTSV